MNHILNNPVWNAMISFNSHLATGNDEVRFFPQDIGPFAGLRTLTDPSFLQLYHMIPEERTVAILTAFRVDIPSYFTIKDSFDVVQMVREDSKPVTRSPEDIVMLKEENVPEMIALTRLTQPGPFLKRTIEFRNYTGIFKDGKLVAMAGRRLHAFQYVEISAVCTHPHYTGSGFAKTLISLQVEDISAAGNIPFLHVRSENRHAIGLYLHLGFTVRSSMNIYIIQKKT